MSEKVLLLSADKWEMPDERTGAINSGVSVWYINDYRDDTDRAIGSKPIKIGCTPEVFEVLAKNGAPGVYDFDFRTRPGAGGKPAMMLVQASFVQSVDLDTLFGTVKVSSKAVPKAS